MGRSRGSRTPAWPARPGVQVPQGRASLSFPSGSLPRSHPTPWAACPRRLPGEAAGGMESALPVIPVSRQTITVSVPHFTVQISNLCFVLFHIPCFVLFFVLFPHKRDDTGCMIYVLKHPPARLLRSFLPWLFKTEAASGASTPGLGGLRPETRGCGSGGCCRLSALHRLTFTCLSLLAEVEFNVSEAFAPLATPNSNHSTNTGNESDSGTLERKRPASMAVMEGDLAKKERCVWSRLFSRRPR